MELKDRKLINNTGTLPGYNNGTPGQVGLVNPDILKITPNNGGPKLTRSTAGASESASPDYMGAVGGGLSMINDIISLTKPKYSADELYDQADRTNASTMGIGYTKKGYINPSDYLGNDPLLSGLGTGVKGATAGLSFGPIGAAVGGIGGLIGGIFGASAGNNALYNNIKEANLKIFKDNLYSLADAKTTALQLKEYVANGRLPKLMDGRGADAMVSPGEVIVGSGWMGRVPGNSIHKNGKPNKSDDVAVKLGSAGVISNNIGPDGIPNSDYAIYTGDVRGALARDEYARRSNGIYGFKNGKLPKYAGGKFAEWFKNNSGWLNNAIPSALGMIASIGLYLDGSRQSVKSPNTYASNPYGASALRDLAGLKINQYPIIDQINRAKTASDYWVNVSGGLSAAQRAAARSSNLYNTQRNIADLLTNVQAQNNAYKAQLANAKLQLGYQDAQRRQTANQFDLDYYSKAHAAREKYRQTGVSNFLSQLQGYYANEFKRTQFNDMMRQYKDDRLLEYEKLKGLLNNQNNTGSVYQMPSITYLTANPNPFNIQLKRPTLPGFLLKYGIK